MFFWPLSKRYKSADRRRGEAFFILH